MSQLKRGAILSYVNIILTNIVGLLLTPFIIRTLGTSEYGLYTLIGAFIGYMSVLDLGLNNTVIRFVSKFRANNDQEKEENFLANTLIIFFGISMLVVTFGLIIYYNAAHIFGNSLTSDEIEKAKIMILLFVLNLSIALPGGVFTGICNGYEKFVFPRATTIVKYIVRSLLVLLALLQGGKAITIIVIDTIMNMLVIVIHIYYVFKVLRVRIKLRSFTKEDLSTIFNYSIWIFIFAMIGQLFWRSGQMVLGITQNTTLVAIFAVGIVLSGYFGAFAGAINSVFLPKATFMIEKKSSREDLTKIFVKIGRILTIFLCYIYGGFLLFGKQFILLWVGEVYEDAYLISLIIMTAYILPLVQNFANSIIEASGKFKFKAKVYFITIGTGIALGAYLSQFYGYWAITWCYSIFWFLSQLIMNWYFDVRLDMDIKVFFKETFGKILLALIISYAAGYAIETFFIGEGWLNLLLKGISFTIVYGITLYLLMLNDFEKQLIFKLKRTR